MPMTKQEMFDKAAKGIHAQGGPALDPERGAGFCCYLTPDGKRKCAFGQLIPEGMYRPEMEGKTTTQLFRPGSGFPELSAAFNHDDRLFVRALQSAHDDAAKGSANYPHEFAFGVGYLRRMQILAKDHKLDTTALEALDWE